MNVKHIQKIAIFITILFISTIYITGCGGGADGGTPAGSGGITTYPSTGGGTTTTPSGSTTPQDSTVKLEINGTISDENGLKLNGAQISFKDKTAVTSSNGTYKISDFYVNSQGENISVKITMVNYIEYSTTVTVNPSAINTFNFSLTASKSNIISQGWQYFETGNYSLAETEFRKVANSSSAASAEKADANAGIGWCLAKKPDGNIVSGLIYFERGATLSDDSKIGAALSNIALQGDAIIKAINYFEQVGLGDINYVYTPVHNIGVSNAEAHAHLAYCYYWRNEPGDSTRAQNQINKALELDANVSNSIVDQIATTLNELGWD